jgi:hypothetical protein
MLNSYRAFAEEKTITIHPKEVKTELARQADPMTVDPQREPLSQVGDPAAVAPSAQQLESSIETMYQHATDTLGQLRHTINSRLGDFDDKIAHDIKSKIKYGTQKAQEKLEEKKAAIDCEKFGKNCPPEPPPGRSYIPSRTCVHLKCIYFVIFLI